ncbi:hypothetical protein [Psychroserpens sp.]
MKKTIIILSFVLGFRFGFSQEISTIYKYKTEKIKFGYRKSNIQWDIFELDRLVLYKDGTFYRNRIFQFNELSQTEYIGTWNKKERILILNCINSKNKQKHEIDKKFEFKVKRKKIIPLSGLDNHRNRVLKKILFSTNN